MTEAQPNSLSSKPYRVSMMPDDIPSVDVSKQTWSDSATNIPEEEASEDSSLNGTYREMPSPTATKAGLLGRSEPPNHLSKHVLKKIGRLVNKQGKGIESGFKDQGSPFAFGNIGWLSGIHEEVDNKLTLLGSPDGEHPSEVCHQSYGVLSPTDRYVFAAVLREGPSGVMGPKSMRKMRDLAEKFEVYEAWAGKGGLISMIAANI